MAKDFEYEEAGRRHITWFALGVFAFLFWIAFTNAAPWWIWAIWSVSGAMIVYLIVANPKSGLSITDKDLAYWAGGPRTSVALGEIARVEIVDWSDSTDVSIVLSDGRTIRLFSGSVPPIHELKKQLRSRNIAVLRK